MFYFLHISLRRSSLLIFPPGQTLLTVSMEILDDDVPEDTETLYVELSSPHQGALLGENTRVAVNVLSNDNGHGVIRFAEVCE